LIKLFTREEDPILFINAKEMSGPFYAWKLLRCPIALEPNQDTFVLGKQCFREKAMQVSIDDIADRDQKVTIK